jgi:N-acetylneuraminate synthase
MDRPGPDICCSMDPTALATLIDGVNTIYSARGGENGPVKEEISTIAFAFASVVAIDNIKKGEKLTLYNIWLKRPGSGDFCANDFEALLGTTCKDDIDSGMQIKKSHINFK